MIKTIRDYFYTKFPNQLHLLPLKATDSFHYQLFHIQSMWGQKILETFDQDIKDIPPSDKELFVWSIFMITFTDQALHAFNRQLHKIWQEKTNFPKLGHMGFGPHNKNPFLILYASEKSNSIQQEKMINLLPEFSSFMVQEIIRYFKEIFDTQINLKDFFNSILKDSGYNLEEDKIKEPLIKSQLIILFKQHFEKNITQIIS